MSKARDNNPGRKNSRRKGPGAEGDFRNVPEIKRKMWLRHTALVGR